MNRLLITCPPMIGAKDQFLTMLNERGFDTHWPDVTQTLTEDELIELVPDFDAWIIGDDPATARVLSAASKGRLRVAIKWGVGVDNVNRAACKTLGIPFENTPHMFGEEVADIALGYVIALARQTFYIDRQIRCSKWPKPRGISLRDRTVGVIGYGNIGKATAERLQAVGLNVFIYDPCITSSDQISEYFQLRYWPDAVGQCDFLVFTCALTESSYSMLSRNVLEECKHGVRIVNVARGPLIDETALIDALREGKVHSAALDVFEDEPLPVDSALREFPLCIFGSHNASNTEEGVLRASLAAINLVEKYLGRQSQ